MRLATIVFGVTNMLCPLVFAGDIISVAELCNAIYQRHETGKPFDFTATATTSLRPGSTFFTIEDNGKVANIVYEPTSTNRFELAAGDRVHLTGSVKIGKISRFHYASCTGATVLAHGNAPAPRDVPLCEMLGGNHDNQLVRIRGFVRDVFVDEIDADYFYMTLSDNGEIAYVTFLRSEFKQHDLRSFVGSEIIVTGACYPLDLNTRRQIGRIFHATPDHPITITNVASQSPFDVAELTDYPEMRPAEIARLGQRKAAGRVIAIWESNNLLIEDTSHRKIGVSLIDGPLPRFGDCIDAVGFPASDLYRVNLTHAIWRPSTVPVETSGVTDEIDVDTFLSDSHGGFRYRPDYHGRCIRLTGTIINLPTSWDTARRFQMKCGRHIVPVNCDSCPQALENLILGSTVMVTGTCIMESENWQPNSAFPRIKGFFVVARTPSDIEVISRPSWWTPVKFLVLIGILVAAIAGILTWNRALRIVAERRGRELMRERLGHIRSEMKTQERTRLAVELHDSLAQSLTGAAMEIEAAEGLKGNAPAVMLTHLDLAAKTITSCRSELRNCLWDLRSQALEERDMTTAIIRTLQPHVNDSRLSVRFNVPRSRLTDNTAHALLRIVRELVLNSIRHGKANAIRVAGNIENGVLKFSVRDDGCGFDPNDHPGVLQGHFGLQGIRERVRQLGGSISILSANGSGTKVTVHIPTPPQGKGMPGKDLRA